MFGQHCLLAEGDICAPIYCAPMHPAPLLLAHRSTLHAHTTIVRNGYTDFSISSNKFHIAYWRTKHFGAPCLFSSQSPINRKWKYVEEKTTATLKSKQISIATVRKHLRTVASLPTPLPFHYRLPLKVLYVQ